MVDGNKTFAEQVERYLKKDKRTHRVLLSLSEQEVTILNQAAKAAGAPVSSFARAAAMLGTTIFLKGKQ